MAISTASDICQHALEEINVLAAGETMTSDDGAFALDRLNALVNQYAAQRLQIYTVSRTTWTITSGVGTYSVASGQTVNRARPVYIEHVYYQDTSVSPTQEYPMDPLTDDAWALLPQKGLTATLPTYWYYNPTFPNGTLELWPLPTSSTLQGVMYAPTSLAEFSALTDSFSAPPAYRRMLIKNLAVDMAPPFGREISPALAIEAERSLQAVKAANLRMLDMSTPAAAMPQGERFGWWIKTGP